MSATRYQETGRFEASSKDGHQFVICVIQQYLGYQSTSGYREVEGTTNLQLADLSDDVNRLERGKYQLLNAGLIVMSDDPEAY